MKHLLTGESLDLRPHGHGFEIRCPTGAVGRARWHHVDAGMGVRQVVRALSKHWSAAARYVVEDAEGVVRLEITKSEGRMGAFDMHVTDGEGRPIGSATMDALRLGHVHPHIDLADADGTAVGYVTTSGSPEVFDAEGRAIADVTIGSTRPVMGQPLYQVRFATHIDRTTKALVVGAIMCWAVRFR